MVSNGLWAAIVVSAGALIAQQSPVTKAPLQQTVVSAPFVGCKSDGQVGPLDAPPAGESFQSIIRFELAGQLAFYKAKSGFGVLAPRFTFGPYPKDTLIYRKNPSSNSARLLTFTGRYR